MALQEKDAYILGTDKGELFRLGVQHQIWASEAQQGWKTANFKTGQTLLDLGSGPGFCSKELAFLVGETGKVISLDRSAHYMEYLKDVRERHALNIDLVQSDFDDMALENASIDGMYCRWAMAWISNPEVILKKVFDALKPGGKMVIHEYYNWATHATEPNKPNLAIAIAACLKSFVQQEGDINIGKRIPAILASYGMKITNLRLMSKLGQPKDAVWNWPKSFYLTYFPKLVEMNYLTQQEMELAWKEVEELETTNGATIFCPTLIEVIAEKQ